MRHDAGACRSSPDRHGRPSRPLSGPGQHHTFALGVDTGAGSCSTRFKDHVLGRNDDRLTEGRRQDVVGGHHQDALASNWASGSAVRGPPSGLRRSPALYAAQTSGCSWMAFPSIRGPVQTPGYQTVQGRCTVPAEPGVRGSLRPGCPQTTAIARSTIFLAALIVVARPRDSSLP